MKTAVMSQNQQIQVFKVIGVLIQILMDAEKKIECYIQNTDLPKSCLFSISETRFF